MRPSANTLLLAVGADHTTLEVTEAKFLYTVFFQGAPIGLRSNNLAKDATARYYRTVFPTQAGAKNMAKRLNTLFRVNDFTAVVLMGEAEELSED